MEWNVKNAVNRDVERQHLNKILADIRATVGSSGGLGEQDVRRIVQGMLPTVSSVTPSTTVVLEGDVTGRGTGRGTITVQATVEGSITDAPIDATPYWRNSGNWESVPDALLALANMEVGGLLVYDLDNLVYTTAEITGVAGQIEVLNGDGSQGNPEIGLAEVTDAGGGQLRKFDKDDYGRVTGTSGATTDDLDEGTSNLYYTDARADARADAAVSAHEVAPDPHPQYAKASGTAAQFMRGDGTAGSSVGTGLFYDEVSHRLGVGNSTPQYSLSLLGATAGIQVDRIGNSPFAQFIQDGDITTGFQIRGLATGLRVTSGDSALQLMDVIPTYACPGTDATMTCGRAARRWSTVYAATGTINTSDAREKTPVRQLTPSELAAAVELSEQIGVYKWLDMIEAKGADARQHIGMTVQSAIGVMESFGLEPFAYGFICHDEWEESQEVWGEEGELLQEYIPAGDRYSFRMDELIMFIAAGVNQRLSSIENRLTAAGL